jgi:hypothetical protein
VKKYLVLYIDETGHYEIDAEFSTLKAAQKFVADQSGKENPSDYNESCSWSYRIYEFLQGERYDVKIEAKIACKKEVAK